MVERSGLDDDRDDHRSPPDLAPDPAADGASDDLLQLVFVGDAAFGRLDDRGLDLRDDLVEQSLILGEAPGVDLGAGGDLAAGRIDDCLLYTSPSPRDGLLSRMPSSA